jgi:hypothetical protein
MPPHEITGMESSVRPKRLYFMQRHYGMELDFGNGEKVAECGELFLIVEDQRVRR